MEEYILHQWVGYLVKLEIEKFLKCEKVWTVVPTVAN